MLKLTIDILPGELADRITILDLRIQHLPHNDASQKLVEELQALQTKWESIPSKSQDDVPRLVTELRSINARLWHVEDQLRLHESRGDFGTTFIDLARSVYQLNDERSRLKREINLYLCGMPGEEKVHPVGSTSRNSH
jgi:hypothetical protein